MKLKKYWVCMQKEELEAALTLTKRGNRMFVFLQLSDESIPTKPDEDGQRLVFNKIIA